MNTYQFESLIEKDGTIRLPEDLNRLRNHRVKMLVIDLEAVHDNPSKRLEDITHRFARLQEEDLDMDKIYQQREIQHERGFVLT
jgi:hypothetical protein